MQRNATHHLMNKILIGLLLGLVGAKVYAAGPLWTLVPAPGSNPTQTVAENSTATVQYFVQNKTKKIKRLVIQPTPGITQTTPCQLAPRGQAGSICTLNLFVNGSALPIGGIHGGPNLCSANSNGSPNLNQCYQPNATDRLNITRGRATGATITITPSSLSFVEGNTGLVTVTNSPTSADPANNVTATIPGGSNISIQSTTCGASLAIGTSCTITFASSNAEGPTSIPIAGTNTNTVNVNVTVTSLPQISITSPVQQSRVVTVSGVTPLSLVITNDPGSSVNANAITVSNKAACPNLSVDDSNCASVAPGASCTLELSSATPYAPCTITVSGSNTANSPQTLIAFFYLGGLVFEEVGGVGKVVIDNAQVFTSQWTSIDTDIAGAIDFNNGVANTNAIIVDAACTGDPTNCAAQRCQNINVNWYLPAVNELNNIRSALCSNAAIPCNFGDFSGDYWSSTQRFGATSAGYGGFPANAGPALNKSNPLFVRCIRSF